MRKRLGTLLVPIKFQSKMRHKTLACTFKHEIVNFIRLILSYLMNFDNIFPDVEIRFDFMFILNFMVSAREKAF